MPDRLGTICTTPNGVAILTLTGKHTVSSRDLLEYLYRQIAIMAGAEEIKGILVTGSESGFCLCSTEGAASPQKASHLSDFGQKTMFSLEKIGKPTIAVIEGECSGVGLEIALSCDFIVASQPARFGFPGIAIGQIPFCGGSQRLARLVGKSKTKELIYSGDLIDAEEAYRIALINRLYPAGEAVVKAEKLIEHICSRSANAIRIGGEVVNAGYDIDLQTACMLERDAFALCFSSFDQREGMQAFLDKRTPHFKGE
ncbi:MAG TPA: enoyl-CoA hydratase/isomerase family protein [Desulfuromonadales bacterium]|nr:enoyl-CoA hydratase/isomerase family protein [Desulfuromonadales bacterium]